MAAVLVMDDEAGITELFDSVLTDEGYDVLTAMNGKHGLEMLGRSRPDLMFLDFMMPVMDGVAVLDAMAADVTLKDIPVVMMSSMPETIVAERCSGYTVFLRKPFRLFELLDLTQRLLRKEI